MLSTTLGICALLFVFTSCTKKDVISNENDLTGTWQVTGISSNVPYDWNGDGYQETDIYGTYTSCERDIAISFDPGGNGQIRQGCNSYWQNMYWQLSDNNHTLNIDLPGDGLHLNIIQFSSGVIRGEDQVYINGNNFIVTYTLSKRY